MDLDQRRRWNRLACDFAELLKRLESGTFPTREDWTLVLLIGTIAEELGRPRPVRMEVEQVWPVLNEGMWDPRGPVREFLVLRSFGPNPSKSSTGPTVSVSISRDEPTSYPVRGLPLRESAFHFVQRGDDPPVESLFTWDRELRDVATFLAGTWLPTIELARPIEVGGEATRSDEDRGTRPRGMIGKQVASQARKPEADPDFQPAGEFPANMRPRLRAASSTARKKKRVRVTVLDGVTLYSRVDAKRWWPSDFASA